MPITAEEIRYSIALRKCAGVGDVVFNRLIGTFGSAERAWKASSQELQKLFKIGHKISSGIGEEAHLLFADREMEFCRRNNITIHVQHADTYPILLKNTDDAPAILYSQGTFPIEKPQISIVGTRNITAYGRHFLRELFDTLPADKVITVSGLAHGVDALVHELSVQKGIPTVAVLAHGLHMLYPAKNKTLSREILAGGGALLTEFNSTQKPDREHFIQRNRIIAGLAETTIVVETAFGGGSISTVTFANQYNRDVYALPGRIDEKYSQGCNMLISQHKARTINTVEELVEEILPLSKMTTAQQLFPTREVRRTLSEVEMTVYNYLTDGAKNLDDLSEISGIPAYRLMPVLLQLEMENYVRVAGGKLFSAL